MTERQIQLVIAARNGDIKCFEQLFETCYQSVYGFARMILKNEKGAEQVLQETFITAWGKLDELEDPSAFSFWIRKIAKNLCDTQLWRKSMAILLDAEQDAPDFDTGDNENFLPAVYAERADLKERFGRIVDGLSEVQRQSLVLRYSDELSVDEISDFMECSPDTVKLRLLLARNAIKVEVRESESKTGQRFFGVAGLPMLPFGSLLRSHMESVSIGQSEANTFLSAITDSILNSTGTDNRPINRSQTNIPQG